MQSFRFLSVCNQQIVQFVEITPFLGALLAKLLSRALFLSILWLKASIGEVNINGKKKYQFKMYLE